MSLIDISKGQLSLHIRNPSDKELFVVFGSRGSKPYHYNFYKNFEILNKNVLFFNDQGSSWYTKPQDWAGQTTLKDFMGVICDYILEIVDSYKMKSLVFFGSSMGAYGAYLYSDHLVVPKHVSFKMILMSLECKLGEDFSKSTESIDEIDFDSGCCDLLQLKPKHKDTLLFFGELNLYDSWSALKLKEQGHVSRLISISDADHYMPQYLDQKIGFSEFMKSVLDGNLFFPRKGYLEYYIRHQDLSKIMSYDSSSQEYLDLMRACVKKYPSFAYGWNRLGVEAHNNGQLTEAYGFLKKSYFAAPSFHNTLLHLSIVCQKMQCFNEALFYSLEGSFLHPDHIIFKQRSEALRSKADLI